jgi:hypothetical protein
MGKGQIDEEEYGLRLRLLFLTCEMLKDMEPPGDEASSGTTLTLLCRAFFANTPDLAALLYSRQQAAKRRGPLDEGFR